MLTLSILARPTCSAARTRQASSLSARHQKPLVRSLFNASHGACLPKGGPAAPARPRARRACSQTSHHHPPLILQHRTYSSKPRHGRGPRDRGHTIRPRGHNQQHEDAQFTPADVQPPPPPPPPHRGQILVQWGFTAACVFIWLQWQYAEFAHWRNYRDTRCLEYLADHFITSERNIKEGRWHTLLSNAVSHKDLLHLTTNMISFHAFVGAACQIGLSPASVAVVGAASAVSCALAQLAHDRHAAVRKNGSLGASGLVAGLGGYVTVLAPQLRFTVFFLPLSIPLRVLTPALLSWDLYNTGSVDSAIGHAGHIGGGLCGLALGAAMRVLFRF